MYLLDPQGLLSFYPESILSSLDFLAEVKNTNLACGQTGSHHTGRRRQLSLLLHVITWRKLLCLGATQVQSAHASASPTSHPGMDAGETPQKGMGYGCFDHRPGCSPLLQWLTGWPYTTQHKCLCTYRWAGKYLLVSSKFTKISVTNSLKQVLNERVRQRLVTSVHQPSLQL